MVVSMQSILIVAVPYVYISLQVVLLGQQSVGTVVADPKFLLLVSTIMMAAQQTIDVPSIMVLSLQAKPVL